MSKSRRRGGLFPRRLDEVVRAATKPLMDKQGKIYSMLLRDWTLIVGAQRAANIRPQRLQWQSKEASGAILHIEAAASIAPELAYETEQMLEACARHFGYRAIERIVIHPVHGIFTPPAVKAPSPAPSAPGSMNDILARMRARITGGDKPDATR